RSLRPSPPLRSSGLVGRVGRTLNRRAGGPGAQGCPVPRARCPARGSASWAGEGLQGRGEAGFVGADLAVDGGEQVPDALLGEVEVAGDRGGGDAPGGQFGGLAFGGGEGVRLAVPQGAGTQARGGEFVPGADSQCRRPAVRRALRSLVETVGGLLEPAVAGERGAVPDERAGQFVGGGRAFQVVDGL